MSELALDAPIVDTPMYISLHNDSEWKVDIVILPKTYYCESCWHIMTMFYHRKTTLQSLPNDPEFSALHVSACTTLLVVVFNISLVLLPLGRTIIIQKRGTHGTTIVTMMEDWCTLQKLQYLYSFDEELPWRATNIPFGIQLQIFWFLSELAIIIQIVKAATHDVQYKVLDRKLGITPLMKNCHVELQMCHLAFSHRSSSHYLSLP